MKTATLVGILAHCAGDYRSGFPGHHVHAAQEDRGPGPDSGNCGNERADSFASDSGWNRPGRRHRLGDRWNETEGVGTFRPPIFPASREAGIVLRVHHRVVFRSLNRMVEGED